jgi:hypothetical protein
LNNERRLIFAGAQVVFPLEHVRANGVPVPEEGEETKIGNDKSAVASFAALRIDPTVTAEAHRFEARLPGAQASLRRTVSNTVVEQ